METQWKRPKWPNTQGDHKEMEQTTKVIKLRHLFLLVFIPIYYR